VFPQSVVLMSMIYGLRCWLMLCCDWSIANQNVLLVEPPWTW